MNGMDLAIAIAGFILVQMRSLNEVEIYKEEVTRWK